MSQNILAIAEQIEGVFRKVTYESLSEGRRIADQLGCELNALVLGDNIENISKELKQFGADRIIVAENSALFEYLPDAYGNVITDVINKGLRRSRRLRSRSELLTCVPERSASASMG